jgi:hypothetical protein
MRQGTECDIRAGPEARIHLAESNSASAQIKRKACEAATDLPVRRKLRSGGGREELGVVLEAAGDCTARVAQHEVEIVHGGSGRQLKRLHGEAVHVNAKLRLRLQQVQLHLCMRAMTSA